MAAKKTSAKKTLGPGVSKGQKWKSPDGHTFKVEGFGQTRGGNRAAKLKSDTIRGRSVGVEVMRKSWTPLG